MFNNEIISGLIKIVLSKLHKYDIIKFIKYEIVVTFLKEDNK